VAKKVMRPTFDKCKSYSTTSTAIEGPSWMWASMEVLRGYGLRQCRYVGVERFLYFILLAFFFPESIIGILEIFSYKKLIEH
jgi:hypothetical protein